MEYEPKEFKSTLNMHTNWSNDLVNEILAEITNYFYNARYVQAIEFIESKFQTIFHKFICIKLAILKLEFFRLLFIGSQKEAISQFYFENIHHLLQSNDKTQEILNNIMSHTELISSKYYEAKCDEFLRLILSVLQTTVIEMINPTRTLLHGNNNTNEIVFKENLKRLSNFETELCFGFTSCIESSDQFSLKSSPKPNKIFDDCNEDTYMAHYYINYKCEERQDNNNQHETVTLTNNTPQKTTRIQKFVINKQENIAKSKPSLKEFNAKFTKRENIDKKILRKFRKYIKEKNKKKLN